jgi:hypothetical protein
VNEHLTCEACRALLMAYSAHQLEAPAVAAVEAHLASCDACQREVRAWRLMQHAMSQAEREIPTDTRADARWHAIATQLPDTPKKGIISMETVDRSDGVAPSSPSTPKRRWRWQGITSVAAVVAFLIASFAVFGVLHSTGPAGHASTIAPCTPQPQLHLFARYTSISKISLVSAQEGWAVGYQEDPAQQQPLQGMFWHYQDCQWQQFGATLPKVALLSVAMLGQDDGWATGVAFDNNGIHFDLEKPGYHFVQYHYTNHAWQPAALPNAGRYFIGGVAASGSDAWLVVESSLPQPFFTQPSQLFHYQDGAWQAITLPQQFATKTISSTSVTGPDDLWLIAEDYQSNVSTEFIARFHNAQWTYYPITDKPLLALTTLTMLSPTEGWAVGGAGNAGEVNQPPTTLYPYMLHFDGTTWQHVDIPDFDNLPVNASPTNPFTTTQLFDLSYAAPGNVWAVGNDGAGMKGQEAVAYHYTNGAWQRVKFPQFDGYSFQTVTMVSADEGWATGQQLAGSNGHTFYPAVIFHYANGQWSIDAQ